MNISAGNNSNQPKRILVLGATGGTGRLIVNKALALGYETTAWCALPKKDSNWMGHG